MNNTICFKGPDCSEEECYCGTGYKTTSGNEAIEYIGSTRGRYWLDLELKPLDAVLISIAIGGTVAAYLVAMEMLFDVLA